MNCPNQGHKCDGCREASRRALGITTDNPMESRVVRWACALLAIVALCAAWVGR